MGVATGCSTSGYFSPKLCEDALVVGPLVGQGDQVDLVALGRALGLERRQVAAARRGVGAVRRLGRRPAPRSHPVRRWRLGASVAAGASVSSVAPVSAGASVVALSSSSSPHADSTRHVAARTMAVVRLALSFTLFDLPVHDGDGVGHNLIRPTWPGFRPVAESSPSVHPATLRRTSATLDLGEGVQGPWSSQR